MHNHTHTVGLSVCAPIEHCSRDCSLEFVRPQDLKTDNGSGTYGLEIQLGMQTLDTKHTLNLAGFLVTSGDRKSLTKILI